MATRFRQERKTMSLHTRLSASWSSWTTDNAVKGKSESAIYYREFQSYEQQFLVYQEAFAGPDVSLRLIAALGNRDVFYRDGSKSGKEADSVFSGKTDRFPSNYHRNGTLHRR